MKKFFALLLLLLAVPAIAPAVDYPCAGVTNAAAVNVRKTARKNGTILVKLRKDEDVTVLNETADSSGNVYYEIRIDDNTTGFVSGRYIDLAEGAASGTAAAEYVYVAAGGKTYHRNSKCSGLKQPERMSLADAAAKGCAPCKKCCSGSSGAKRQTASASGKTTGTAAAQASPSAAEKKTSYVYITSKGKKYHSRSTCSGMKSPKKVSLSEAKSMGYTACKKCY